MKKFFVPLLIAVMSFTACSSSTSNFVDEAVLKIDGQEIMKSEYMVHLYTASTELVSTAGEEAWNMDFDGQSADELLESHISIQTSSVQKTAWNKSENPLPVLRLHRIEWPSDNL